MGATDEFYRRIGVTREKSVTENYPMSGEDLLSPHAMQSVEEVFKSLEDIPEQVNLPLAEQIIKEFKRQPVQLKDSGTREQFPTGSQRDSRKGKGRFDLLFSASEGILRVAQTFEKGAEKYDDNNWKKGQPLSRFLDSALRHLWHVAQGHTDEDHIAQAAWNCICLMEIKALVDDETLPEELDDLY